MKVTFEISQEELTALQAAFLKAATDAQRDMAVAAMETMNRGMTDLFLKGMTQNPFLAFFTQRP